MGSWAAKPFVMMWALFQFWCFYSMFVYEGNFVLVAGLAIQLSIPL